MTGYFYLFWQGVDALLGFEGILIQAVRKYGQKPFMDLLFLLAIQMATYE